MPLRGVGVYNFEQVAPSRQRLFENFTKAPMRSTTRKMAVNMASALFAFFTLIGISELSYDNSMDAMDDVAQAQLARGHVQRLLRDVLDAETGQRGYLLTGDTMYLEPYKAAIADIGQTQD